MPEPLRRVGSIAYRRMHRPRWGNLRRYEPFSRSYGFDRGTPVDRVYIERFLSRHADAVRGAVLEVMNAGYTQRFGGGRVTRSDVLDIVPDNAAATVFADLTDPDSLPTEAYDCFILTQTICLVTHPEIAVANAWRSLRPGGVLLMTEPVICPHDPPPGINDRWRFTPTGLATLLDRSLPGASIEVESFGNLITSTAYLHGMAAEELSDRDWRPDDPQFPVTVAARVDKRGR